MRIIIEGIMSDGKKAKFEEVAVAGWAVDDDTIATIENGVIKPIKTGTTKLIANIGGIKTETTLIVID